MTTPEERPVPGELELFFRLSLDLLCVAGTDTYFRRVNPAFVKTLGYSQSELLSISFIELIHPDDRDSTLQEIEKLRQGLDTVQFENRYRHKNGGWRRLSWTCPAPDDDGEFLYAVARDVSVERAAEEELRVRDSVFNSMHHGLAIADATQPDLPLTYVNPAFEKLTEYSQDEILGKNCRFLQGEDPGQLPLQTLRKSIKDAEPCRVLLRNYKKSGQMFWNEVTLSPVHDESGALTHFVGFQNDVTNLVAHNQKRWDDISRRIAELPVRQREVLDGLLVGQSIKQLALELGISSKTVETHRLKMFQKMEVNDPVELVRLVLTSAPTGHYDLRQTS